MSEDEKEFLIRMYERLYRDRFFGAADHYAMLLEKAGLKYSAGEISEYES
jgi:hypothetical protein